MLATLHSCEQLLNTCTHLLYPVVQTKIFGFTRDSYSFIILSLILLSKFSNWILSINLTSHHYSPFLWSMLPSCHQDTPIVYFSTFQPSHLTHFLTCSQSDHINIEIRSHHIHAENASLPFLGTQSTIWAPDSGPPTQHNLGPTSSPNTCPLHGHRPALPPPPASAQRTPAQKGSAWPRDPLGFPLLLSVPCLLASPWTLIWTVIILLDHSTLPTWPSHEHGHSIRAGIVSLCAVGGLPPAPGTVPRIEDNESMEERC